MLFLLSNSQTLLMDKIMKNKMGFEPVTSCFSGYRIILVVYYLTKFDNVIWSGFWVTWKIVSANFCKPIHGINYSSFIGPFEFGNWGKEGKNYKNLNILRTK